MLRLLFNFKDQLYTTPFSTGYGTFSSSGHGVGGDGYGGDFYEKISEESDFGSHEKQTFRPEKTDYEQNTAGRRRNKRRRTYAPDKGYAVANSYHPAPEPSYEVYSGGKTHFFSPECFKLFVIVYMNTETTSGFDEYDVLNGIVEGIGSVVTDVGEIVGLLDHHRTGQNNGSEKSTSAAELTDYNGQDNHYYASYEEEFNSGETEDQSSQESHNWRKQYHGHIETALPQHQGWKNHFQSNRIEPKDSSFRYK